MNEWTSGTMLAQGPGGLGGAASQMSKAASENDVLPVVVGVAILILVVLAVIVFKLKKE